MRDIAAVAILALVVVLIVGLVGCSSGISGDAASFPKTSSLSGIAKKTSAAKLSATSSSSSLCGNRKLDRGEICDDGNRNPVRGHVGPKGWIVDDSCSADCKASDSDAGLTVSMAGVCKDARGTLRDSCSPDGGQVLEYSLQAGICRQGASPCKQYGAACSAGACVCRRGTTWRPDARLGMKCGK